jgi:hypothetical protein
MDSPIKPNTPEEGYESIWRSSPQLGFDDSNDREIEAPSTWLSQSISQSKLTPARLHEKKTPRPIVKNVLNTKIFSDLDRHMSLAGKTSHSVTRISSEPVKYNSEQMES